MVSFALVQGTMKLSRLAKESAAGVNVKRRAKGLLPRPVSFQSSSICCICLGFAVCYVAFHCVKCAALKVALSFVKISYHRS